METKVVSKRELHKMIDEFPSDKILVLTYDSEIGCSDNGKREKKRKCIKLVNAADQITLTETYPVQKIDLLKNRYGFLDGYGGNITKSIMLASPVAIQSVNMENITC